MNALPKIILKKLSDPPAGTCCWVAFSGGIDSTVLLHVLASVRDTLSCDIGAVHVNHGLQAAADAWADQCATICEQLAVPYVSIVVDGKAAAGESPEAAARHARYTALADWLPQGDTLLTAQHQDDQAETLLLQLLRGSGVAGMAAMPRQKAFGKGLLLRPLLEVSRAELVSYANDCKLEWIEDSSNADIAIDRNFLRHEIIPDLQTRWPALAEALSRSAQHCSEAAAILDEAAQSDLEQASQDSHQLNLMAVLRLSLARQHNVLRYWLKTVCGTPPSTAVLARIMKDFLNCREDAEPVLVFAGYELRRYRQTLYLLSGEALPACNDSLPWRTNTPLELPGGGRLSASPTEGTGLSAASVAQTVVQVSFRQGGERCQPAGRHHHHALKKLFQEHGIPPWERQQIPLIYLDRQLAAVADLWVCEPFCAGVNEPGLKIIWSR